MSNIVPSQAVEYSNQRILTTEQVASAYCVDVNYIYVNFHNNKDRFTLGKHYFLLEGEELKQFKLSLPVKFKGKSLYLWTEKGALLLAKSLGTDQAWQACELLIDEYYRQQVHLAALQEQNSILRIALAQALEVPHLQQGPDYAQLADIETVVNKLQETHQDIDKLVTLCRKLGNLLTLNLDHLERTDGLFVQQASTLLTLDTSKKLLN